MGFNVDSPGYNLGCFETKAKRIPTWQLYNEMAGPIPFSLIYGVETEKEEEEIILIPYGCTKLRISQFHVIGRK